jgi:hypothetical protein
VTSVGNATVIAGGVIVNADVNASAAIAYSKLGTTPTWNQNTTGNAATVTNGVYTSGAQTIGGAKTLTAALAGTTATFSGAVGIGTATPAAVLDIRGDDSTSAGSGLIIGQDASTDGGTTLVPNAWLKFYLNNIRNGAMIKAGRDSAYGSASHADGNLQFHTALDDTLAEHMRITSDGNVGIGTTNPGELLEVGADGNTDYALIGPTKIGGGMGHGDYAGFSHRSMGSTGNYCLLQYSNGSTYLNAASGQTVHLRVNNGNILKLSGSLATFDVSALFNGYIELDAGLKDKDGSFGTNGYVLTTDGAGDVTWSASPGAGSVDGSGTAGYIPKWTDGDTIGNSVVYETAAGTIGIHAGTNVEGMVDVQMKMNGVDWTYGDWDEVWCTGGAPGPKFNDCVFHLDTDRAGGVTGGIVGLAFSPGWQGHQNWGIYSTNESGGSYTQGDLRFVNQLNTPAGTFNERVTFKADGNVGIGTTAPGSYKLRVEGDVYISGTLTEASSLAIKENIETYSPSLEKINKIRPVRYNKKKSEKKEVGLVAEELAEMFPELVERDEKGNPAGVNYSRAVAVLLHGFKELYKEVKELKEKI